MKYEFALCPLPTALFVFCIIVNFVTPDNLKVMVQDVGNRLILAYQKQIEKVVYFCRVENISPNLAVHEIRKSFKRMRALLKFYADSPDQFFKECKKQLLSQGKSLALLRESYVNILVFEQVTTGNKLIAERKIKTARDRLHENNRLLLNKDFFENESRLAIHELMKQFESQLTILKIEQSSKSQIMNKLCSSFFKSYNLFQNLSPEFYSEELHRLRKKLKVLYYQMDFLKFIQPRYFKLKSDQLNKITEQLGQDHDLFIFFNEIKKEEYAFEKLEIEIIENQVQHLRELNLLKVTARLKHLFRDSPEVFNLKIDEVFM